LIIFAKVVDIFEETIRKVPRFQDSKKNTNKELAIFSEVIEKYFRTFVANFQKSLIKAQ